MRFVLAALLCLSTLSLAGRAAWAADVLPITASSIYDARYQPEYAFDGSPQTRWASRIAPAGAEWLQVDLGKPVKIDRLAITWEAAYAVEYELQVSGDGRSWHSVYHQAEGHGGKELIEGLGAEARFVRLNCLRPGPFPLYSVWEIEFLDPATAQTLKDVWQRAVEAHRAAMLEARQSLADSLKTAGVREIVFAVRQPGVDGHWYANFGYYANDPNNKLYRPGGGRLCRLDLATGSVTSILDDPQGCVRDPQVGYDGARIVFSYLKGGTTHYHLYEINVDGSGLRQLTDGDWDDLEPTYLPDGGFIFCSSRCNRWVNCWLTPVATLHRCDADGSHVRALSANVEHDNTPWVLPDGRILYMRWEYVDRSQVDYHHLWTCDPDGTEQMVYFGNMAPGTVMLDAKPIPNTRKTVAIFSPGHGLQEHQGQVTVVDPGDGPDDPAFVKIIPTNPDLRDPYPLDDQHFLVAKGAELQVVNLEGDTRAVYQLPAEAIGAGLWCHEPRPLAPRPREARIVSRADTTKATGRLIVANAYDGRNMAGVKRGDIRKLLVLESLPKPINYTGGMDPLTCGGSFTLERVVGTVPVEADGSAYLELPALRSFFFVALDEHDLSVKRMQSFLTVQPGEVVSCVGCHEQRTRTVPPTGDLLAMRRPPSPVTPLAGIPEVFDFPRDIQPILDRHCVACHDYDAHGPGSGPRAGRVILTGDRGPMYSHSYYTLTYLGQFVDGRDQPRSNLAPRSIGTAASPLMKKLSGAHHGVVLSPHEIDLVRYWIESGAPYPGTYGALGCGSIGGYYANGLVENDEEWPSTKPASEAIRRRCLGCHAGAKILPASLADERDVSFWRPDWNDPRLPLSRHRVFNLTRPEKSLILLAPLAQEAGGYGLCREENRAVFAATADPDYQRILAMCAAGKERLETIKRFDLPGFRPPQPYLRELARYGVLAQLPGPTDPVDPYALDRAYWRSLWFQPRAASLQ